MSTEGISVQTIRPQGNQFVQFKQDDNNKKQFSIVDPYVLGNLFSIACSSTSAESLTGKSMLLFGNWKVIKLNDKKVLVNIKSISQGLGINTKDLKSAKSSVELHYVIDNHIKNLNIQQYAKVVEQNQHKGPFLSNFIQFYNQYKEFKDLPVKKYMEIAKQNPPPSLEDIKKTIDILQAIPNLPLNKINKYLAFTKLYPQFNNLPVDEYLELVGQNPEPTPENIKGYLEKVLMYPQFKKVSIKETLEFFQQNPAQKRIERTVKLLDLKLNMPRILKLDMPKITLLETFINEKVANKSFGHYSHKTKVQIGGKMVELPLSVTITKSKSGGIKVFLHLAPLGKGATKKANRVFEWNSAKLGARVRLRRSLREEKERHAPRIIAEAQILRFLEDKEVDGVIKLSRAEDVKADIPGTLVELMDSDLENVAQSKEYSAQQKLEMMVQVAETLSEVHENNVVHLDIKPANMLCRRENGSIIVKVSDFDAAALFDPVKGLNIHRIGRSGTPFYSAPEGIDRIDIMETELKKGNQKTLNKVMKQLKENKKQLDKLNKKYKFNLPEELQRDKDISGKLDFNKLCDLNEQCAMTEMAITIMKKYGKDKDKGAVQPQLNRLRQQWGESLDAYNFGKSLQEMIYGRTALRYPGRRVIEIVSENQKPRHFKMNEMKGKVPLEIKQLNQLISELTHVDPMKRPSLKEVRDRLSKIDLSKFNITSVLPN